MSLATAVLGATVALAAADKEAEGVAKHVVESEYQKGPTEIRVLLPEKLEKGKRYPVVYVLPVEAGTESRFGNGLNEVKKLDLHNKHGLIFVAPTFSQLPWYADHPTKKDVRQETYFVKTVLPLVEEKYPALAEQKGRLLLGFSKSGWGAFSLLLRHPDVFGRAVAWDAPLNMQRSGAFGSGDIFGTQENFEKYQVTKLLEQRSGDLGKEKRLALTGYANFREHHVAVHELMMKLKVPHEYREEKKPKHTWDAGWIEDSVKFLTEAPAEKQ
jgi:S-formylglutathione hydrolase FrmB